MNILLLEGMNQKYVPLMMIVVVLFGAYCLYLDGAWRKKS